MRIFSMFWNFKIKPNENLNIPCTFSLVDFFFLNHSSSLKITRSGPVRRTCLGIDLFLFSLELEMSWVRGGGTPQLHPLVVKVNTDPLKFCLNCRQPWERSWQTDYRKQSKKTTRAVQVFQNLLQHPQCPLKGLNMPTVSNSSSISSVNQSPNVVYTLQGTGWNCVVVCGEPPDTRVAFLSGEDWAVWRLQRQFSSTCRRTTGSKLIFPLSRLSLLRSWIFIKSHWVGGDWCFK